LLSLGTMPGSATRTSYHAFEVNVLMWRVGVELCVLCTLFVAAVMCVVYGICDCCYAVICVMFMDVTCCVPGVLGLHDLISCMQLLLTCGFCC